MKKLLLFTFSLMLLTNCATGPTHGFLFTSNSFAGEFNPANDVKPVKTAEGCSHTILHLIAWGDAGVGEIAMENKIERISSVDHSTMSVFSILYKNYCTIVTGEGRQ